MTREQVNRTLRYMEHIREQSYEAETVSEERRLTREYARLWNTIEPYVSGAVPYSPTPVSDTGGPDAQ